MSKKKFRTNAVRAGQNRTEELEHSDPIFATSSFVFHSAEHAAELFAEKVDGNIYSRFTNPTVKAFEQRLATLENAEHCVATASGMSAVLTLCMTSLQASDHIVAAAGLFGSTTNLFKNILSKFDISTTFVSGTCVEEWKSALRQDTKMIFIESPSNPLCDVFDITEMSVLANKQNECLLVVDNCACTPALQQPLDLGADVVIHSSTKFLDGQGRAVGGAIVTNHRKLTSKLRGFLRTAGPSMSPFNAWIFHKGLETLSVRMKEACDSALKIARFLDNHSNVKDVFYPGLECHPGHELAHRQQEQFGAIVSFEVDRQSTTDAWRVIDALTCFSITANIGDVKSIVTHPATTTHSRISQEDRDLAGITDRLIRLSVGLEDVDDLIADLRQALAQLDGEN